MLHHRGYEDSCPEDGRTVNARLQLNEVLAAFFEARNGDYPSAPRSKVASGQRQAAYRVLTAMGGLCEAHKILGS